MNARDSNFHLVLLQLVGYTIKPGGSLVAGGPSITGPTADGLHTELTMFQMYKVALSAGKAHRDHKHHHVHKFGHNGPEMTTQAPPPAFVSYSAFIILLPRKLVLFAIRKNYV